MKHQFFAALFLPIFVAGCGGYAKMDGRVTYSDTGEPLEKGIVVFTNETFQARGIIGEDGRYAIGSFKETDGLPKGTYQIFISGSEDEEYIPSADGMGGTYKFYGHRIDTKYYSASTSGITMEVDGKTKSLDFQVDRHPNLPKRKR